MIILLFYWLGGWKPVNESDTGVDSVWVINHILEHKDSSFVYVAPLGSSNIQFADFICDGDSDEVEIRQALATGKNVMLLDGEFHIYDGIWFNVRTKNYYITGIPQKTILIRMGSYNYNMFYLPSDTDVIIENLIIDGNKNKLPNGSGYDFWVDGGFDIHFRNLHITNTKAIFSVAFGGTNTFSVKNSFFDYISGYTGVYTSWCKNGLISENIFDSVGWGIVSYPACSNMVYEKNIMRRNKWGIDIEMNMGNTYISNNLFENNEQCIRLTHCADDTTGYVYITNNLFWKSNYAINIDMNNTSEKKAKNIFITNNQFIEFINPSYNMITNPGGGYIENIHIKDNLFRKIYTTSVIGLSKTRNMFIEGNTFDSTGNDIWLTSDTNVIIKNNIFQNGALYSAGIVLNNVCKVEITSNIANNKLLYWIQSGSGNNNIYVSNNIEDGIDHKATLYVLDDASYDTVSIVRQSYPHTIFKGGVNIDTLTITKINGLTNTLLSNIWLKDSSYIGKYINGARTDTFPFIRLIRTDTCSRDTKNVYIELKSDTNASYGNYSKFRRVGILFSEAKPNSWVNGSYYIYTPRGSYWKSYGDGDEFFTHVIKPMRIEAINNGASLYFSITGNRPAYFKWTAGVSGYFYIQNGRMNTDTLFMIRDSAYAPKFVIGDKGQIGGSSYLCDTMYFNAETRKARYRAGIDTSWVIVVSCANETPVAVGGYTKTDSIIITTASSYTGRINYILMKKKY